MDLVNRRVEGEAVEFAPDDHLIASLGRAERQIDGFHLDKSSLAVNGVEQCGYTHCQ
jgi:hypothetical protein